MGASSYNSAVLQEKLQQIFDSVQAIKIQSTNVIITLAQKPSKLKNRRTGTTLSPILKNGSCSAQNINTQEYCFFITVIYYQGWITVTYNAPTDI